MKLTHIKKIIDVLPDLNFKAHCLLRLLIFSGMRKGEALALKWSNIDFQKNQLDINAAYSYSKYNNGNNVGLTKNKQPREIPLESITKQILIEWKDLQATELKQLGLTRKKDSEQLIFNNTVNNYLKITYPNDYLKIVLEKADIKFITVHGLRHTHITHLVEAGAELFGVKDRVGHFNKNSTTEEFYIHATDKIKKDVLQCLLDYYTEFDIK